MPRYEYKIVPAPNRGLKADGVKGAEARFSHALECLMNDLSSEGWEYQRAETLPSIERSGLTSTTTEWRNVLVFRRLHTAHEDAFAPDLLPAPANMPELSDSDAAQIAANEDAAADVGEAQTLETEKPVSDTLETEPDAQDPMTTIDTETWVTEPDADKQLDNGVEDTTNMDDDGALRDYAKARAAQKPDS